MNRRRKRLLFFAGLAAVLLLLIGGLFFHREPVYQGKTVHEWAFQLSSPTPQLQQEAAASIRSLGSNAVPSLVRMLNARDSFFRKQAWKLASKLPSYIRQPVLRYLHPPDAANQRLAATRAVTVIGPTAQTAVPALSRLLCGDADSCWHAAVALGAIGRSSVPVLIQTLTNSNANVRRLSAYALGAAGTNAIAAAPALFETLDDKQDYVRYEAGSSLAKLGPDLAGYLTNLMASPSPAMRIKAARTLGGSRPPRSAARPALLQMLHDPDPACRVQAAQTMACVGLPDRIMVEALIQALDDPVASVRLAAVQSLNSARMFSKAAAPALNKSLSDPSPEVREAATKVLAAWRVTEEQK